jgi:hypothetical protein
MQQSILILFNFYNSLNIPPYPARDEPNLVPLLLDSTARQHTRVDGFDMGGLNCGNVDPALSYCDYVVRRFGRAGPDREEEGPFAGSRHAQVRRAGTYVILHLRSNLEGKRFGKHWWEIVSDIEIDS